MTSPQGVTLGLIVEGHGEEHAIQVLIRHILTARGLHHTINCSVRRVPKSLLVKPGELERAVEALARQIGRRQPMMVLLDSDNDCPKVLASDLQARCLAHHADVRVSIVIAKREYEAWFLAAASSLAGKRGLEQSLIPPADPESIQGAKEWLTAHMTSDQSYSPTRHQAAYSELMDLSEARRARSFRKFEKEVGVLLGLPLG